MMRLNGFAVALGFVLGAVLFGGENAVPELARVPWTTSHVSGSPEPPLPFVVERVCPKLKFDRPLDIEFCPGSDRIFIATQRGNFFSFKNDPNVEQADLFFDRSKLEHLTEVPDCTGTSDALALVFDPHFKKNRYCYMQYNLKLKADPRNVPNGSRISRFTVTNTDPPQVDCHSEVIVIDWLGGGHDGCTLRFGPDGYLYISTGDGANPNPPDDMNTGQDISDLLSSVLRIDVEHPDAGKHYSIPKDNPFVNFPGARGEVWAYGLRNPFRMNFDSKTGNLWVGDVGWELWEMIYCVKSAGNYGWNIFEGPNSVNPTGKRGPTEISKPQAALSHTEAASITGGLVYRGTKFPELYGHYVFGDWQTNRLWEAKVIGEKEDNLEPYRDLAKTDLRIVAFVEDREHEPLILDHGAGGIYRLARNPLAGRKSDFPRKLSETGLFTSVKDQTPAPGVLPFEINAAQWNDGGKAQRWIAIPGTEKVVWGSGVWGDSKPQWPKDSVLVRTVRLQTTIVADGELLGKKIETQLLHFDGWQWNGYTYAWDDKETDAELVPSAGLEYPMTICDFKGVLPVWRQTWHYPSRGQCMSCHTVWTDYANSFNDAQLNRDAKFLAANGATVNVNQVQAFRQLELLLKPKNEGTSTLTNPYDDKANVTERARSYLDVNCSTCHRFGGGGAALIDVRKDRKPKELNSIDETARLGNFAIDGAKIICPGDPNRSVLLYRASKLGTGRMPHICSDVIDDKGLNLLRKWIAELPAKEVNAATTRTNATVQALKEAGAVNEKFNAALTELLSTTSGALALLGEIQTNTLPLELRKAALEKAIAVKQEAVRDLFRRYDPREALAEHLGANIDRPKLLALAGDAARGKKVFFETSGGLCAKCHKINGQGTDFGPDFSHIGTKYDKAQLLENILEPSKTIAEGYTSYLLKKKSGEIVNGLLVSKTEKEIVMRDIEHKYTVAVEDIAKFAPLTTSAMPEGLLNDLSAQDAADLLEFLRGLK